MEWCFLVREAGAGRLVAVDVPARQDRHRGYHDSDPALPRQGVEEDLRPVPAALPRSRGAAARARPTSGRAAPPTGQPTSGPRGRPRAARCVASRRPAPTARPREAVVLSGGGSLGRGPGRRPAGAARGGRRARPVRRLLGRRAQRRLPGRRPDPARVERARRGLATARPQGRLRRQPPAHGHPPGARDDHLYEPDALRALVRSWVPLRDLAETAVPCHVVTTDLRTVGPAGGAPESRCRS